jgi:protein involved in polysaccharide export with SLBB domain
MGSRHLAWAACLLAGCSTAPGGGLFPQGHRLIDPAKEIRASNAEAAALPRELDKRVTPPFAVEPGDVLLVYPADLDSPIRLPGDQPVLPDGTITLGRYGRLQVAGRTAEEIQTEAQALIRNEAKDAGPVVVRIVSRQSKVVYVLGEVNAPGAFTLSGRETVLDAIILAGGLTDRASRDNILLSRPTGPCSCRLVLPVCYNEIVQLGDTSTNYQVVAGDRVFVPTRTLCEELHFGRQKPCLPCGRMQHGCPLAPETCQPRPADCPAAPLPAPPPVPPPAQLDTPRP